MAARGEYAVDVSPPGPLLRALLPGVACRLRLAPIAHRLRLAPIAHRLRLAPIVALVLGGCATPTVTLAEGPREYVATDYDTVLNRWTRTERLFVLPELET
jgi:hypothetical protein